MTTVGLSDRLPGLITQLEGAEPDVLLLDWVTSFQSMSDLMRDLSMLKHRPKIIVFSIRPEDKERVITAGGDYFISKAFPPDELLPILNEIQLSKNHIKHKET
jgi:DNA-binding response OmpR family regulator